MAKIVLHKDLADGRWNKLTLTEQMANIYSEVGRAGRYYKRDQDRFYGAVGRALELFDLTIEDKRWRGRVREIGRVKALFCDAVLGGQEFGSSIQDVEKYLLPFALLSRAKNGAS